MDYLYYAFVVLVFLAAAAIQALAMVLGLDENVQHLGGRAIADGLFTHIAVYDR